MSKTHQHCLWLGGEGRVVFVIFAYFSYYLIEAEKTSVTQWPALRVSLVRQKIINPNN